MVVQATATKKSAGLKTAEAGLGKSVGENLPLSVELSPELWTVITGISGFDD